MARAHPLISNFNGGELSPLLGSRPDLEKYQAGLLLCENAVARVQGALERRAGSAFVSAVRDSAQRCWLSAFVYSQLDAFILEWSDLKLRFYRARGVFLSEGAPYEIDTPFPIADLTDADGTLALRFQQSGDVIYITHASGTYPPYKLTRVSNTNWTLVELTPTAGPFADRNTNEAFTVQPSGATGTITLTASQSLFLAGHVGSLFYLESSDFSDAMPWAPRTKFSSNALCRSDGKTYKAVGRRSTSSEPWATGDAKPVHTRGRAWDGDIPNLDGDGDLEDLGIEWEYLHPGYGWVRIETVASGYSATATVLSRLPDDTVNLGTFRWAKGAWSDADGWPDTVTFYRDRLTFMHERRGWASVSGDYENFAAKDLGTVDVSSALSFQVQSGRGDVVKWLVAGGDLIAGTGGSEVAISPQVSTQAFGPGNVKQDEQEGWGSTGCAPVKVGGSIVFVERSASALRELVYSNELDAYTSEDLTAFAEHLFASGVVQLAYERKPKSVVWAVRADGMLLGCTYLKAQNVAGWHRHVLGGQGVVESVATVPSPDGRVDDVWLIVRRTINGETRRYVEYLTQPYKDGDDASLINYADSGLSYSGAAVLALSGLDHLEGQTVQVKANGASHAECVVTGGAITLTREATKVVVGLHAPMRGQTMPLEFGAQGGTAQGKKKRVHALKLRLLNTLGGAFGQTFARLEALQYRTPGMTMDQAPPLFSGIKPLSLPGDYDDDAGLCWVWDNPFPCTLVALMPEMVTNEG